MSNSLLQLIILFIVIFDPMVSLTVFFVATEKFNVEDQHRIAIYSVLVAGLVSAFFLLLGDALLVLFGTDIDHFRIAGGIILMILGINMVLGKSLTEETSVEHTSATAISSIIGSPILAGPATITTIIITTQDNGILITALAILIVLLFTGFLLYHANFIREYVSNAVIQVLTSILGLITISWGVKYVLAGYQAIIL